MYNKPIDPMEFDDKKIGSRFISSTGVASTGNSKELIRPIQFEEKLKSPEEKIYIILYYVNSEEENDPFSKIYSVCMGRTDAYTDIKNKLLEGIDVDVHRSYIITETRQTETETGDIKYYMIPYKDCISIYSFCVSVKEYYSDDDFDIEDYSDGDIPEGERLPNPMGNINSLLSADQMQYRKMLEESIQREKFITSLINNGDDVSRNV